MIHIFYLQAFTTKAYSGFRGRKWRSTTSERHLSEERILWRTWQTHRTSTQWRGCWNSTCESCENHSFPLSTLSSLWSLHVSTIVFFIFTSVYCFLFFSWCNIILHYRVSRFHKTISFGWFYLSCLCFLKFIHICRIYPHFLTELVIKVFLNINHIFYVKYNINHNIKLFTITNV